MRWENLLSGLFLSAALPCALAHGNHAATTAAEEEQEPAVTQEQLDELQAKWGQGVSIALELGSFQLTSLSDDCCRYSGRLLAYLPSAI